MPQTSGQSQSDKELGAKPSPEILSTCDSGEISLIETLQNQAFPEPTEAQRLLSQRRIERFAATQPSVTPDTATTSQTHIEAKPVSFATKRAVAKGAPRRNELNQSQ